MVSNNYVHEISDDLFTLSDDDKTFLEALKEAHKDDTGAWLASNNLTMQSGYKQWHIKDGSDEEKANSLWNKISTLFTKTSRNSVERVVEKAQLARVVGELKIHVDYRATILTIPLVDLSKPITFWSSRNEDKEILYQYTYTKYKPLLVNTHIEHNVIDNDEDRIFLQLGGFKKEEGDTFQQVVEKLPAG